jgi:hypothetical protein
MRKTLFILGIALGVVLLSNISYAHCPMKCGGCPGWQSVNQDYRMYELKTVESLNGEVISVDEITTNGKSSGVHLTLKTENETISVHLGPSWFINNQDTRIEKQDTIEVKGSRVQFDGKPAIIAAEIMKGDQTLKLRDENGIPVWSGWRRK